MTSCNRQWDDVITLVYQWLIFILFDRYDHMTLRTSGGIRDIWTIELNYQTTVMAQSAKLTSRENPTWRRPPYWIRENIDISGLDEDIRTEFGGKMHRGTRQWSRDLKAETERRHQQQKVSRDGTSPNVLECSKHVIWISARSYQEGFQPTCIRSP